jgi:hypothetical protein
VTGIEKEEGMLVGVEELLAMDVLKRIGSITMSDDGFRSRHHSLVVAPDAPYIHRDRNRFQQGTRSDLC